MSILKNIFISSPLDNGQGFGTVHGEQTGLPQSVMGSEWLLRGV